MTELQEKQIEKISLDIDQQGLTFTPLKNELLDHICCQIEMAMEQGMTFNEAYRKVRTAMGRKRIRQIQDETLTLISKKYRRMKRIMYGLGVAAPVLVIIAALFKVNHWPGGGLLITLALFITGMVFLPLFVMVRIRDTRRMDEPVPLGIYLTGMIAGMFAILGTLFKVQHWPGASIMLTLGLAGLALVFLPLFARYRIRESKKKNEPINKGLWIGGIAAGMLVIIGMLFKIMHWPGASIAFLVSWSLVAVVFLPLLVLNQLKQSENRINSFFGILLVAVTAAIFIMALMRSTPEYYSFGYVVMENSAVGQANYYQEQSRHESAATGTAIPGKAVSGTAVSGTAISGAETPTTESTDARVSARDLSDAQLSGNEVSTAGVRADMAGDPADIAGISADIAGDPAELAKISMGIAKASSELTLLHTEADALCNYIQSVREELAFIYSGEEAHPVTDRGAIDAREIYLVGKSSLPYEFIVDRDENRVFDMLEAFRVHALQLTAEEALITFIDTQFSFNPPEELDQEQWSKFCFTGPLMHSIAILGTFESTVRMVEREILNAAI
jgi:hypothetical protein